MLIIQKNDSFFASLKGITLNDLFKDSIPASKVVTLHSNKQTSREIILEHTSHCSWHAKYNWNENVYLFQCSFGNIIMAGETGQL